MKAQIVKWTEHQSVLELSRKWGTQCQGVLVIEKNNLLITFDEKGVSWARYLSAESTAGCNFVIEREVDLPDELLEAAYNLTAAQATLNSFRETFKEFIGETEEPKILKR